MAQVNMQQNVDISKNLEKSYVFDEDHRYTGTRNFNIWRDWVMVVPVKDIFLGLEYEGRRRIDVEAAMRMLAHFREYPIQQIHENVSILEDCEILFL